jgi:hypothetical protein
MVASAARLLVITSLALAAIACQSIASPTGPDKNWNISTSGHFTFYVRPGSFAEQTLGALAPVLEDQFAFSVAKLGIHYNGHVTLYLYNAGSEAGFGGDSGGGDHSGVAYPATETVKVAAVPPFDANLMSLISHEVNHVIIWNGLGRPGTSFLNEGLASAVLSERFHNSGPSLFHQWVGTHVGQYPALTSLVDDDEWRNVEQARAYSVSASFLAYLLETYDADKLRRIYSATSRDFSGRFQDVYGVSLNQAQAAWETYCRAR